MIEREILQDLGNGKVSLQSSNETSIIFAASLIWQMVDSYYIVLMYTLSMIINKHVEFSQISKKI
jgi:hypothetical protein